MKGVPHAQAINSKATNMDFIALFFVGAFCSLIIIYASEAAADLLASAGDVFLGLFDFLRDLF
jgi:hypothetical protein